MTDFSRHLVNNITNETFVNTLINNSSIEAEQNKINRSSYVGIYIAILPFLIVGGIFILACLCFGVILPLYDKILEIKIKIINRYESRNLPIVNNKLNKSYIKKLNKENLNKHTNMCHTECSICLEEINNKKKIVLDCGHTFDISCLQKWTSSQVSVGKKPECPLCRGDIVRQEDYKTRQYIVINYRNDRDSSTITTLSDLL